jgi:hypothetical protein
MVIAQDGAAVDVIVDDESQVAGGVETNRVNVHPFGVEEPADAAECAGAVGEAESEFLANHARKLTAVGRRQSAGARQEREMKKAGDRVPSDSIAGLLTADWRLLTALTPGRG